MRAGAVEVTFAVDPTAVTEERLVIPDSTSNNPTAMRHNTIRMSSGYTQDMLGLRKNVTSGDFVAISR